MPSSTDNRKFYLSLLKALACLSVVFLHTYYASLPAYEPMGTSYIVAKTVRNLMMAGVPCFVMATGELLLDPNRIISFKRLFEKYILRALVLLIAFTGINLAFDCLTTDAGFSVKEYFIKLIGDGSWSHMWYLYLLLAIYLTLPLFKLVTENADRKTILFILGVFAVFMSVIPTVKVFFPEVNIAFYIPVTTVYPLYLLLGYARSRGFIKLPGWAWAAIFITSSAAVGALSVYGIRSGRNMPVDTYASVLIVLQACSFYQLISYVGKPAGKGIVSCINKISDCTMGIYLIHMILLKTLFVVIGFKPQGTVILIPVALGIFAVSFIITFILKLIPGVKRFI